MKRVILILSLFICCFCSAQIYKYIGVENGLSNRMVYSIKKDKKGYMWFLTYDGIDRFDGKLFKHYKLIANGIDINTIAGMNQLYTDNNGCIWEIGKDGQIFKYNSLADQFQLIYKLNKEHDERQILNYAYIDRNNNIWLCTTRSKQYIYNIDSHKLYKLNTLKNKTIIGIEQIDGDTYCMGTSDGVYTVKLLNGRLQLIPQTNLDTFSMQVNAMYYHEETRMLYIGTFLRGVFVYNFKTEMLIHPDMGLQDININSIKALNENEILVATDGAGIYKINAHTFESKSYIVANYDEPNGMNGNSISDIYIDEEQRIWMANYPMGITVLNNRYPSYKWIKHSIGNPQSLINNQINCIIEDYEGDIWYATNNGISVYHKKSNKWVNLLSSFQSGTSNKNHIFTTLCEVRPGIVFAGGYTSGMYWIDKKNMLPRYFVPALFQANIHPDKYIRAIYKDSQGYVWVGGYYYLKKIDLQKRSIDVYPGIHSVNTIAEEDSAHIWVGCSDGLFLLDKQAKKYKRIELPTESMDVNVVYQDTNGILYIGTNGSGLIVYNSRNNRFTLYDKDNSALLSNSVYTILSDGKGAYLILSTENGLSRFSIKNKTFSNWTSDQGLMTSNFNATSGAYTSRNTYIIGSGNGAIEVDADSNIPKRYSSKLVFSDFRLFYKTVYPGKEDSPLKTDIDETKIIELQSYQNILSLKLSSINYDYPSNILYSWKLDGFYSEWSRPGTENVVRYTNLIPGRYKLLVRTISKEDQYVLEERELKIVIHPPFRATVWAMLVYSLIIALIAWAFIRYFFIQKDRKVSKDKIRFFINTAHEIRTPLTLIKAPLEDLKEYENLSVKGMRNLQIAARNADNLQGIIGNLIDYEKINIYSESQRPDEHQLSAYLEDIINQYAVLAEAKRIDLKLEGNIPSQSVWFDKSNMDIVMRNLITNAIKYTPENGYVNVRASINKNSWSIEVEDSGIGIPDKELKKVFNPLFRATNAVNSNIGGSGVGLMLVKKSVSLQKGKIEVRSVEGKGSTFILTLPLKEYAKTENKEQKLLNDKHADRVVVKRNAMVEEQSALSTEGVDLMPQVYRVLIVEDNDDLRAYLSGIFKDKYHVFTAINGKEGLEMTRMIKPDLVISDIMMPVMDGEELCKTIKSDIDISHIPIVFLSAKSTKEDILHGLQIKADGYLTKPFEPSMLKAIIAGILDNREILKRKFAQMDVEETDCQNCVSTLDFQFISKVNKIIDEKMSESEFSVDKLCFELGMSRTSFYNKIKVLTGYAPNDYIKEARLKKATTLLKAKEHTITEIAEITGFSDAKYFREVFKKRFNVTPGRYADGILASTEDDLTKAE